MSNFSSNLAYGIGGFVKTSPPALSGNGPPAARLQGAIGQEYIDIVHEAVYIFTGSTWVVVGGGSSDLSTLTGNTGGAISPTAGNINILGSGTTSVAGSGSTLTISATSAGYPITPYVVGPSGKAGYQTIQSAVNAANTAGGGIIYVQPGSYTENLTLYGDTQIVGVPQNSDAATSGNSVTITGVHTPPTSGSFAFFNINLVSATHIFSSTAAGTASLLLENCFIVITSGYTFNLPNWTGSFTTYALGDASTNNGMVNNTGGAFCFLLSSTHGAGTAYSMITSGTVQIESVVLNCPWSAQTGTVIESDYNIYTQTVTLSNNTTGSFNHDRFSTGSTAALTQSSTGTISISNTYINSSHSPAITGTGVGVLTITDSPFVNNTLISNSLTTASNTIRGGNFNSQYVVALDGTAPYKVIQSAINDARAYFVATGIPQTVYVKPGAYTENLTFYDGIDLCGANSQVDSQFLTVTGLHTLPVSGDMATYGIWYKGTTACFTAAPGGTCKINMFNVITEISGTGYTFDIDGYAGEINIFDFLQFDGGNNGFVNNPTGGCEVNIIFAGVGLTQNTSATAQISGNSFFQGMLVSINMNFVSTSYTQINMGCELQGTISTANSASVDIANTYFYLGSAAAISHGSSGTVNLSNVGINSSATTVIGGSGAGTLSMANVCFLNSSGIASTLTLSTNTVDTSDKFRTSSLPSGTTLSANTWSGTGSASAIDMNITPKGTGKLAVTTGNIQATNGNLVLNTAGNKIASTSVGSTTSAGANSFGTVALSSGTATVSTTAVTANSMIFLTCQALGTVTSPSALCVSAQTASTSFVITASQNTDTSTVAWFIVN